MIYVFAELRVRPSAAADVIALARPCLEATRREDGCLSYALHQDVEDPDRLVFVETWRDRAALERHFTTEHVRLWRERRAPFVEAVRLQIVHPEKMETL